MPGQGFSTIGLKPVILEKLHNITEEYFPGMFLPSTLIIMMNEIKRDYYNVNSYNLKLNLEGNYNSVTIRSDVKMWLEENYKIFGEEYKKKYQVRTFAPFLSYFLVNMFQSKIEAQNHVIKLKASDFKWLLEEYKNKQEIQKNSNENPTFEQFAADFLKELLTRVNEVKKILTI
jgi:hypothetical protein